MGSGIQSSVQAPIFLHCHTSVNVILLGDFNAVPAIFALGCQPSCFLDFPVQGLGSLVPVGRPNRFLLLTMKYCSGTVGQRRKIHLGMNGFLVSSWGLWSPDRATELASVILSPESVPATNKHVWQQFSGTRELSWSGQLGDCLYGRECPKALQLAEETPDLEPL